MWFSPSAFIPARNMSTWSVTIPTQYIDYDTSCLETNLILEYTISTPNQQLLPHNHCNSNPTDSHPTTRLYTVDRALNRRWRLYHMLPYLTFHYHNYPLTVLLVQWLPKVVQLATAICKSVNQRTHCSQTTCTTCYKGNNAQWRPLEAHSEKR
jgi:hypothetical protein